MNTKAFSLGKYGEKKNRKKRITIKSRKTVIIYNIEFAKD